ncbi:MAG: S9 family peptidase [Thermoguttaceae bacterium]|nr:S9 family peptidase [Thermoguttaceae bacterium]
MFFHKKKLWAVLTCCLGCSGFAFSQSTNKIDYPTPPKGDHVDTYFNTEVADPYRWMEDEQSVDLHQWIDSENKITQDFLSDIPYRETLKEEITQRYNYEKYSLPWKKNHRYFFLKNNGLQNQSVLYTTDSLDTEATVLLDPNTLSEDGTVSLANLAVSKDGRYLAYALSTSGSDWQEVYILDIETGTQLPDHLKWIKFSELAWKDHGFYYSRYDAPPEGKELSNKNEHHKIYYHQTGTSQEDDQLVFENQDAPLRNCVADIDRDENWLFLYETESTYGNILSFRDLRKPDATFQTIFPDFQAESNIVAVHEEKFYVLTDWQASNRRLVLVDPANPLPENWKDVIPETDSLLQNVAAVGDRLVVKYLKDASNEVLFYDFNGQKTGELELPALGVCNLSGEKDNPELFYNFTSYVYPTVSYRYDLTTGESTVLFQPKTDFVPEDYTTERVWYTSKDGTRAPIFVTWKKGMQKDGTNPTLLYGYGGFNICMTPSYSPTRTVFLDHGGILAVAVLRGGGEYGENWHKAGTKLQKQNVFDDFIAAAEYLIQEKYTSSEKLAINGGSNGGLLVGAVMTQRPELFKVAVPQVGVMDMLRYHHFTIGWAWATDYGTSEESEEMFRYLLNYSPLHTIKKGISYPATLVTTSDHDDRVVPAHSFKFAATLQAANQGENPILIRIETRAGHGSGKPLSKIIEEAADIYSFILFNLGIKEL